MAKAQVFISYGRQDAADFAARLANWLREEGFEPWLDVDQGVPVGSPYDIRIEIGIIESDLLIAVLSPSSLRPEGFCRNELLFAQSHKVPIVPVRIAPVDPPIQIISLNYLDAANDLGAAFCELPELLEHVLRTRRMPHRQWADESGSTPWWAEIGQLAFEEELERYGGIFVGRDWLFEEVRQWANQPDSRVLLVTADAGVGKSVVAAQLTARLNVKGAHFCSSGNIESCRGGSWVASVVYQMAAQLPGYRAVIEKLPVPRWDQPASLFRSLVADPVRSCEDLLSIGHPWVFVVDGLDEALSKCAGDLGPLLADAADLLPRWMRLVVTSRPDEVVLAMFRRSGVERIHIDALGERQLADIGAYIAQEVGRIPEDRLPPEQAADLAECIETSAAGNFLFAKMTLSALRDLNDRTRLVLSDVGRLPQKLGGLYHAMFRKRFADPEEYASRIAPLLDCLVAAQGPLPRRLLAAASGLDARSERSGLRSLSQFVRQSDAGLSLFHRSVADWLADTTTSAEFSVFADQGHARLADVCWQEYETAAAESQYTIAHLATHLRLAGRWDQLEDLLTDIRFLEMKTDSGLVFALARDFSSAIRALPAARPRVRLLRLLEEALRRDIHFIAQHTGSLFQCLWNTCWWHDCPEAALHYLEPAGGWPSDGAPWSRPDLGLCSLLESWRSDRLKASRPTPWLRSLRPPLIQLGGAQIACFQGHLGPIAAVVLSPDGRWIASGGSDKTIRIWDVEQGHQMQCLQGHEARVSGLAAARGGKLLVSTGTDRTVRLWDVSSGTELRCLRHESRDFVSVACTPGGHEIFAGTSDGTVWGWKRDTQGDPPRCLRGHAGPVWSLACSPNGRLLASASDDTTVRLWDLESGMAAGQLDGHTASVSCVAISGDGEQLVSAGDDATMRSWDLASLREIGFSSTGPTRVLAVAFSPDGRSVVTAGLDGTVRVWDVERGVEERRFRGHEDSVSSVVCSSDGTRLVSASWDGTIRLWDRLSSQPPATLRDDENRITCLGVAPDGSRFVTVCSRGTLRIWETRTGRHIACVDVGHGPFRRVGFSRDGRRIVLKGFERTQAWDVDTCAPLDVLPGLNDAIDESPQRQPSEWRLGDDGSTTTLCQRTTVTPLARFPLRFDHIARHPELPIWIGTAYQRVVILQLEDS